MTEPSTPPSPAAQPISPPTPTGGGFPLWGKVLLGCGLVVLVVMVVVGGLAFWAVKRLVQPGKPVEAIAVVREDSVGWVRIESMADDQGMSGLTQRMFLVLQRIGQQEQREELPEWMRGWYDLSQAQQANNPALKWMMPREMTLAFDPRGEDPPEGEEGDEDEESEDEVETLRLTASLNLGFLARMFGWIGSLDDKATNREEIQGHQAIVDSDSVMIFLDGTLLITENREEMERLLTRIETQEAGGRLDTDPAYAALADGAWDVFGRLDNRDGDFTNPLWDLAEGLGMDPAIVSWTTDELTFRFDVVTAETLEAELTVDTIGEEAAEEWLTEIDKYRDKLEAEGVRFELDRRAEGPRVFVTWRIDGLAQWLGQKLVTMIEESERKATSPNEDWQEDEELFEGEPGESLPVEQPPEAAGAEGVG